MNTPITGQNTRTGLPRATFAILIISNIAVFGLGVLVTNSLLADSMSNIMLEAETVRIQNTLSTSFTAAQRERDLRNRSGLLHVLTGQVTGVSDEGSAISGSIVAGTTEDPGSASKITARFDYPLYKLVNLSTDPRYASYRVDTPLTVQIGEFVITTPAYTINVYNDAQQSEPSGIRMDVIDIRADGPAEASMPVAGIQLLLRDPSGTAFTTAQLPSLIDLNLFTNSTVHVWGSRVDWRAHWSLFGSIVALATETKAEL